MDRKWNRIGFTAGALAGIAGMGYVWLRNRFLPQTSGRIALGGLHDPVEVIRDRWGVPHIYAQNEADLMFAQGFVHAQDRLWQMDFQRRLVAGRLSEVLGEQTLPIDRWMRILCLRQAAEKDAAALPQDCLALIDAYQAGINACIDRGHLPLEFTLLGYRPEPWTSVDSISWGKMMAWMLSVNWEAELLRAQLIARLGPTMAAEFEPTAPPDEPYTIPPGTPYSGIGNTASDRAKSAQRFAGPPASGGLGSNNWVISGSRTATGLPLLANDMHLLMGIPAIWYENHLVAGDLELSGVTFPSVPGIVAGHNRQVAWGFTNGFPDVQDLFMEHLRRDPDGSVQYEFKGEWLDAEVRQEAIPIKGGKTEYQEVVVTRHGPIINQLAPDFSGETPLALQWTAYDAEQLFVALYDMNRANNCLEFRDALRHWGTPSQNAVYADTQGNIGYTLMGRIPIRSKGDGRVPVPGWSGEYEWTGCIPFDELPHLYNPPQGYIATANNRTVDESYPHFLGTDYISSNRVRRIRELIDANPKVDIAAVQDMQFDQLSLHARSMARLLGSLETDDPELKPIIASMHRWDGTLSPDSTEAAIYEVFYRRLILVMTSSSLGDLAVRYLGKGPTPWLAETTIFGEHAMEWIIQALDGRQDDPLGSAGAHAWDTQVRLALRQSVDELKKRFGPSPASWKWKKLHRIRYSHTLGSVKPLDKLFNRGPYPLGGDSNTLWNTATAYHDLDAQSVVGPPFRFIASLADLDHCLGLLSPGQSGHPLSPHYADQLKSWSTRGYHPMLFSRPDVDANTEAKLLLLPLTGGPPPS